MSATRVSRVGLTLSPELSRLTRRVRKDNLRQLMRGWSQHARSSASRRQSLAIMTSNVQQNLLRTAMSQWMYRARSLVLDPMASTSERATMVFAHPSLLTCSERHYRPRNLFSVSMMG